MAKIDRSSIIHNLTTRTKLLASFGLVSLIIFAMGTFGVLTLRQMSAASQVVYASSRSLQSSR